MHLWYRLPVWNIGSASWISWGFSQSESRILFINIFPLLSGKNVHILIQCLKNGLVVLLVHYSVKSKVDGHWWKWTAQKTYSWRPMKVYGTDYRSERSFWRKPSIDIGSRPSTFPSVINCWTYHLRAIHFRSTQFVWKLTALVCPTTHGQQK